MRIVGLDIGRKTIGVALSDPDGLIAQPITTIKRTMLSRDIEEVLNIARENAAEKIIAGFMP